MASIKSKALKEHILEDEQTEEIDADEIQGELDIKGKPIGDLRASLSGKKGNSKTSEAEVKKTPVSNSILNAAGNAIGESKISQANNVASSTSIKQEQAPTTVLGELKGTNSSSKLGLGWISFEEDGNKRAGSDLVTQQTKKGTPLSTVVNGDSRHTLAKTPDSKTQRVVEKSGQKPSFIALVNDGKTLPEMKSNNADPSAQIGLINGHVSQEVTGVGSSSSPRSVESDPASPSWVTFEDTSSYPDKAKGVSVNVSSGVTNEAPSTSTPPKPNWITFDESNKQKKVIQEDLHINVSIENKPYAAPSTPSPNPFVNAPVITPKPASLFPSPTPLTVVTSTNPFHSGNDVQGSTTVNASSYSNGVPAPVVSSELSSTKHTTDLSQWVFHDVSVFEKDVKLDQNVTTVSVEAKNKPSSSSALPATTAKHIDEGVAAAVAAEVNEEKPAVEQESDNESLDEDLNFSTTNTSWNMLLRYPDKKRKLNSREWKSVVIKLDGNTLKIYEEYELSEPFREIPLQASFSFDQQRLQPSGRHGKIHTTKLMYLNYKETRSVRQKGTYEHVAEGMPIIKVGSASHLIIKEFTDAIGNSVRTLPAYRDRGITYRKDEVFVDVDDTCYAIVNGDGTVTKQGGNVRIKVRAFLTGDPECQMVLNDVVVKEREEARLRGELKPQHVHHWINLRDCHFHKCANASSFEESHAIIFHPLDACTFELMQFRVKQPKPLPLSVKASLIIHSEQRIELRAEIKLCQDSKMSKYARNNVTFRLPIPETWVPLFRTGGVLGREKSIKSSKGKRAAGIKSRLKHSRCSIAASLGTAQYEPEYSAVVWRIDKLPLIQSKIPVDAPQTLNCLLELPSGMECPDNYQLYAELEYDISYVLLSDTTVIAVKVSNQSIPEKWVCYKAFYQYHIDMVVHRPSVGPIKDVGCTQQ